MFGKPVFPLRAVYQKILPEFAGSKSRWPGTPSCWSSERLDASLQAGVGALAAPWGYDSRATGVSLRSLTNLSEWKFRVFRKRRASRACHFFFRERVGRTSISLIMAHKKCARGNGIGFWNSERLDWSLQTGVGAPTAPRSRHSRVARVGLRSPAHLPERKF